MSGAVKPLPAMDSSAAALHDDALAHIHNGLLSANSLPPQKSKIMYLLNVIGWVGCMMLVAYGMHAADYEESYHNIKGLVVGEARVGMQGIRIFDGQFLEFWVFAEDSTGRRFYREDRKV